MWCEDHIDYPRYNCPHCLESLKIPIGKLMTITDGEIERRFNYHKPDETRLENHKAINRVMMATAKEIRDNTPPGREQAVAITKLEEARMWANAAVACDPDREKERRA